MFITNYTEPGNKDEQQLKKVYMKCIYKSLYNFCLLLNTTAYHTMQTYNNST